MSNGKSLAYFSCNFAVEPNQLVNLKRKNNEDIAYKMNLSVKSFS